MKNIVKRLLTRFQISLKDFYNRRKDQFLIFTLLAILLLYLRVNPLFPYYLTDRKIFYIFFIMFFLVFRIGSKGVALIGFFFLLIVTFSAFLGRMGMVNKLIVYAWGFFLVAAVFQVFELWISNNEKNIKS